MLEEPGTDTEQVVCHALADADFRETLFGDGSLRIKEVNFEKPRTDFLLRSMDREIFADFRESFDSNFIEDFSAFVSAH